MQPPTRILFIESSKRAIESCVRELRGAGVDHVSERVSGLNALEAALSESSWNLIVCDGTARGFKPQPVLDAWTKVGSARPPMLFLGRGRCGEDVADLLRAGVSDYVELHHTDRLVRTIRRELSAQAVGHEGAPAPVSAETVPEHEHLFAFGAQQGVAMVEGRTLVHANDGFAHLFGYDSPLELIGTDTLALVAPEDHARVRDYREARLTRASAPGMYEYVGIRKDGTRRKFVNVVQLSEWQGRPAAHITVIDMTGQDRLLEGLKQSEQNYWGLLNSIQDGVAVIDRDWQFAAVNRAWREMPAYPVQEWVKSADALSVSADSVPGFVFSCRRVMRSLAPLTVELEQPRTGETSRHIEYRIYPALQGVLAIARDVTERHQSEQASVNSVARFRDLAEAASDWFWETDDEFRFINVSDQSLRVSGMTAERVLGKTRWEVAAGLMDEDVVRQHRADLEAHRAFREYLQAYRAADGSIRHARVNGNPVFAADGAFIGYRGTATDVTEATLARQQAEQAHQRLLDAIETLPAGFMLYDRDERFVLANSRQLELVPEFAEAFQLGKTLEDRLRLAFRHRLMREMGGTESDWIAQTLAYYRNPTPSRMVARSNGRWFAEYDRRTREGGLVSIRLDVTDQKRQEAAILSSEQRFRALVESSIQGTLVHRDFKPLFVSESFARMFGYSNPNQIMQLESVIALVAPEEQGRLAGLRIECSPEGPAILRSEFRGVRSDGGKFWFDSMSATVMWEGKPATLSNCVDITESKRREQALAASEARFRGLIEQTDLPILVHRDFKPLFANMAYARLFGFGSVGNVMANQDLLATIAPDEVTLFRQRYRDRIAGKPVPTVMERRIVRRDGSGTWVQLMVTRIEWEGEPAVLTAYSDLTERRRAEDELRTSQRLLRAVFDAIPARLTVKDRDRRFILVNRWMETEDGRPEGWYTGRSLRDVPALPDSLREEFDELDRKVLESGMTVLDENRHWTLQDGRARIFDTIRLPIKDDRGGVTGIVTLSQDMTAHRLAEEEVRSNQRILRTIVDALPLRVSLKDTQHRFVFVNRRIAEEDRLTREWYPSRSIQDNPNPTQAEKNLVNWEERRVLETGEAVTNSDLPWTLGDGMAHYFETSRIPVKDDDGRIAGIVTVAQDITRRKAAEESLRKSEARFRGLIEHTDLPVLVHRRFRPLLANRAYARLFGFADPSSVLAQVDLLNTCVPEDRARSLEYYARTLRGENIGSAFEREAVRTDGSRFWVRLSATRIDWEDEAAVFAAFLDITDRKRAENELQDSQRLLQTVFNSIPMRLSVLNDRLQFVMVNRHMADEDRLPQEWYPGRTTFDLRMPTEDQKQTVDARRRGVIESGEVLRDPDFTWITRNRELRHFDMTHVPLKDGQGRTTGLLTVTQDITEHKRIEAGLRASEKKFRDLLDGSIQGICVHRGSRPLFVNRSFAEMYGFSGVQEAMELPTLIALCTPNDRERLDQTMMMAPGKRISPERFEFQAMRRDGSNAWIEMLASVIEWEGTPAILATQVDVTERKRAEEELRESQMLLQTVFDALPVWISVRDRDLRYVMVNRLVAEAHGVPAASLRGKTLVDSPLGAMEENRAAEAQCRLVLDRGETVNAVDTPFTQSDGAVRILQVVRVPLKDDQGSIKGVVSVSQDVTESRRMGEQLDAARRMEAIGRLAGGVAHDFNNILAVIIGFSDFLLDSLLESDPARSDVSEIRRAADRATTLTRQLLAFSRRQVQRLEVIDLNEVLRDMQRMMGRLIGEDVEIRFLLEPKLSKVKADASQIEQVILNLAVNARDAMPKGGALTLETANATLVEHQTHGLLDLAPGSYVTCSVTDTGTGMDESIMRQIFEPFFTTKLKGKGTGLGLATVYGILKQSGGGVDALSRLGHGTTFRFFLPATSELPALPKATQAAADQTESGTILLAEDEVTVRQTVKRMLESAGYHVIVADDPDQAAHMASELGEQIDLLLTDIIMPIMSGPELAKRVVAANPEIAVLYMSGYTDDALHPHGIQDSGVQLVQKPFTRDDLLSAVRKSLAHQGNLRP